MTKPPLTIEFFHDVICAYCYAFSPRVRRLSTEYHHINIIHRCFALSKTQDDTIAAFRSKERAKQIILEHWVQANINDDEHRIKPELMRSRSFDYPHSLPGQLGCMAAELQGGQSAHWDYFDSVQKAHLSEARNIADDRVLMDVAKQVNLDVNRFKTDYSSETVRSKVNSDIELARRLGVTSVPTLVINCHKTISGALKYDELEQEVLNI